MSSAKKQAAERERYFMSMGFPLHIFLLSIFGIGRVKCDIIFDNFSMSRFASAQQQLCKAKGGEREEKNGFILALICDRRVYVHKRCAN